MSGKRSKSQGHGKDVFEAFFAQIEQEKEAMEEYKFPEEAKAIMPIFITCKMALDRVEQINPLAKRMFHVCGFLYAENIPLNLLHLFFPSESSEKVTKAMELLKSLALLHDRRSGMLSIHRTHQYVILETLKKERMLNPVLSYVALQSILIIDKCVADGAALDKRTFQSYLVHIVKVTENLKEIPHEEEHTILKVKLAEHLLGFYTSSGIKFLEEAYREKRSKLGMCGADCLKIQNMLADRLMIDRQYERAREILEHTLNLKIQKYGEEHRETLHTQYQIGKLTVCETEGFYSEEGLLLLLEVYEKQKACVGEGDEYTRVAREFIDRVLKNKEKQESSAIEMTPHSKSDSPDTFVSEEDDGGLS